MFCYASMKIITIQKEEYWIISTSNIWSPILLLTVIGSLFLSSQSFASSNQAFVKRVSKSSVLATFILISDSSLTTNWLHNILLPISSKSVVPARPWHMPYRIVLLTSECGHQLTLSPFVICHEIDYFVLPQSWLVWSTCTELCIVLTVFLYHKTYKRNRFDQSGHQIHKFISMLVPLICLSYAIWNLSFQSAKVSESPFPLSVPSENFGIHTVCRWNLITRHPKIKINALSKIGGFCH